VIIEFTFDTSRWETEIRLTDRIRQADRIGAIAIQTDRIGAIANELVSLNL